MDGLQADDPERIGSFRLLGRLGEGGMGRVYLGTSPGGRKVAIKVVHAQFAADPEFRRRFAREVEAARRVGGFHTALVVDAAPDAELPWMATAYIPGPSLAAAIAERGPLQPDAALELAAGLAEGLVAIHACGLIHRDLKPSNVILADDGPRIIDFGVAKGANATTALTGTSAVIGTLRYMSPEQLQGRPLTPNSDVFALGTVLAYAATGRDPFDAPTIPAVITRILSDEPTLDPLAGELRDILTGCLAKEAANRPNPADLLTRLNSAAPGAPSEAPRPPTPPVLPETPGATVAADRDPVRPPIPSTVTSTRQARRALQGGQSSPRRNRRRTALVAAGVTTAAAVAVLLAILVPGSHPASNHPASNRVGGVLRATLAAPSSGTLSTWSVAFGPDGTLATADGNGNTYLWNTTTGHLTATLTDPSSGANGVDAVAFGPGGTLAAGDSNGNTYLWNTTTRHITATFIDSSTGSYGVQSVAFGPGGTLAAGDVDGSTYLWNTATATGGLDPTLSDPGDGSNVQSVAFGPHGTLATGDYNGNTYLWNTTTRRVYATFTDPDGSSVHSVAFGPHGTLATGDYNGNTYLWNTMTRRVYATLTDPSNGADLTQSVAFGPGGTLATSDGNGNSYLWNTMTRRVYATFTDPSSHGINWLAFGPDNILATGDFNGSTYLWNTGR